MLAIGNLSCIWNSTANLTTTVVHSYKLLRNDIKPVHSLTQSVIYREALYITFSVMNRPIPVLLSYVY